MAVQSEWVEIDGLDYSIVSCEGEESYAMVAQSYTSPSYWTDLVIPSSVQIDGKVYPVKEIRNRAFSCYGLTSVLIPNSVTKIGDYAFEGNYNLTSITIPSSVIKIGQRPFNMCSKLSSVIFNATECENIQYDEFGDVRDGFFPSSVENVIIGDGVTRLPDGIFSNLKISRISIPATVKTIGKFAFNGCINLASIDVSDSLDSIGQEAFRGCSSLESIAIPSSVTSIGRAAFIGCSSLKSIAIPSSVTSLEEFTFCNCTALASISIPSSVISIGEYAFYACSSLTSLTIPASIQKMGKNSFSDCSSLTSLEYNAKDCDYHEGYLGEYGVFPCSITALTIGDGVTRLPKYVFSGLNISSVIIPNSVKTIGPSAFNHCEKLEAIAIPNSVTEIGEEAFSYCKSLKKIEIPLSVSAIEPDTFEECYNLTEVLIPNSVKTIGSDAFAGCENLKTITIPNSVTSVGEMAFARCTNLSTLTIPASVTEIGEEAFAGDEWITTVNYETNSPITANKNIFNRYVYTEAVLNMPMVGLKNAKTVEPWCFFAKSLSSESGIDIVSNDSDGNLTMEIFDCNGIRIYKSINNLPAGLYLIRQGDESKKLVIK